MRKRHQSRLHLLSVRQVQTAAEGDHGDGGGLVLRVRGDCANFVFRFTALTGKRREMGLGTAHRGNAAQAGDSLTSARDLAAEARAQLQRGVDPIDERERAKADARTKAQQLQAKASRADVTLARAARGYHERVIEPSRTDKHAAQWIASLENHVPDELWNASVASVTAPALLDFLVDLHNKVPETAMRIRQRLEAVFEDAVFRGLCDSNPAAATKRKLRESKARREKGRFAALPFAEAPAFMAEVHGQDGIGARCLEFAMLTAARTGEAISAEWREFDLDAGLWVIPGAKMKAKEPHTVYLSPRAVEVVKRQQGLDRRYVFPSPRLDGKPVSNMAMLALLSRMNARERTTVHGLCRATFSTWAYETGAARSEVIEACLAHRESDLVKAAYNRAQFAADRRALLATWATYLDKPREASNVVKLHAA